MSSGLEAKIEQEVVNYAEGHGLIVLKLNLLGNRGWPDRWFLDFQEMSVLIEFKKPGEVPDPLQIFRHQQLIKRGFCVAVIDSVACGIALLDATLLSARLYADYDFTSMRGAVLGPRLGKDVHFIRGLQDIKREEVRKKYAGDRTVARLLQRLAEGGEEVVRIQWRNGARAT